MAGKVCLVTGAARGLGLEFCRAFVGSGCTSLAVLDLLQSEAQGAAEELKAYGKEVNADAEVNAVGIECDVSSEESVKKAFESTIEAFGRVDAVVASAGIVHNYSALEYPVDKMKRLYDINVHGSFFTAREAAKHMIPQGSGAIVFVASMSANIVNVPQLQMPYNASKAAVKHMAETLAVEWGKTGVRVNILSPGYMQTKLLREVLAIDTKLKETWEAMTPMGRLGNPEDLAGAIVFLAPMASPALQKFVIFAPDKAEGAADRASVRDQHVNELTKYLDNGTLKYGGMLLDPASPATEKKMIGTMVIVETESLEAARKIVEEDIYFKAGVWDPERLVILPFMPAPPFASKI
uniref:NAD(P)-binding protein n=1 Tax=Mycena chlorophos TaxID=658473 RepID=A0ABQ0LHW0_MYCCL|nr:NAD(P)-binding protein [Mycena chlorophos]